MTRTRSSPSGHAARREGKKGRELLLPRLLHPCLLLVCASAGRSQLSHSQQILLLLSSYPNMDMIKYGYNKNNACQTAYFHPCAHHSFIPRTSALCSVCQWRRYRGCNQCHPIRARQEGHREPREGCWVRLLQMLGSLLACRVAVKGRASVF